MTYLLALTAINLRSNMSLRWAFLVRMGFMALNNLIFVVIWVVFFYQFKEIGGWTIHHMLIMFGMTALGYGLFVLIFDGFRDMAYSIDRGELDGYLIQPKPVLLSLGASKSDAAGFGEFLSGIILCGLAWPVTSEHVFMILLMYFLCGIFWSSIALILGSVAFYAKDMNEWGREMLMSMIIVGTKPAAIYQGFFKIIIFTAMPVGFMTYLPIQYLVTSQLELMAISIFGVLAVAIFAIWFFYNGLKRYESGNRFGIRG